MAAAGAEFEPRGHAQFGLHFPKKSRPPSAVLFLALRLHSPTEVKESESRGSDYRVRKMGSEQGLGFACEVRVFMSTRQAHFLVEHGLASR